MVGDSIKLIGWIMILFCVSTQVMGCGYSQVDWNQLEVRSDGTIRAVSYASFPEDKYDFDALKEEVAETIDAYNEEAQDERISLHELDLVGEDVRIVLYYDSTKDYVSFNHVDLLHMPLEEALQSGNDYASVKVHSVDGTKELSLQELLDEENGANEYVLVVTSEAVRVLHAGDVLYCSDRVTVNADGSVVANEGASDRKDLAPAYIVYGFTS